MSAKIPKLRRQKQRNGRADQAFVVLNKKRVYLGDFGTVEADSRYRETIAEWLKNGQRVEQDPEAELFVVELAERYLTHARTYYRDRQGNQTAELMRIKCALKRLREVYGHLPVSAFGPKRYKTLRHTWVEQGLARSTLNGYAAVIKRMFKWAANEELIDSSLAHALHMVPGLKLGRSKAREPDPIQPVRFEDVAPLQPYLSKIVWSMILLQWWTGMRSGELVIIRPCDVDVSGKVWEYRPTTHKLAYRGKDRVVLMGKEAQSILEPFLARPVHTFCFSPRESNAEIRARNAKIRRRANQIPTPRKTDREMGERFDPGSYRQAITRAINAAGVDHWSPHRLRHAFATRIRKDHGLTTANVLLGHQPGSSVTTIYAAEDRQAAARAIAEAG